MVKAGYVRQIGPSGVGADTIRRANAVHPVSDVQIECSLISRGIEGEILPACRELGIGITAYGVLSRGLISGHWSKTREGERDFRTNAPRFQGANLDANLALVEKLPRWRRSPSPGSRSRAKTSCRSRLTEALGALDVKLSPDDLAALARAVPPDAASGERYPAAALVHLDSEKRKRA